MPPKGRLKIKIVKCDILSLYADGIVNAANSDLEPGLRPFFSLQYFWYEAEESTVQFGKLLARI